MWISWGESLLLFSFLGSVSLFPLPPSAMSTPKTVEEEEEEEGEEEEEV